MNVFRDIAESWIDYFGTGIPKVTVIDVIEMIIIAVFFYKVLEWVKDTRAWMLLRGMLVIILFFVIAGILQMSTILWLGEKLVNAAVIALVVVFQPELRHALETLGRSGIWKMLENLKIVNHSPKRFDDKIITELVKASYSMGAVRTGALIVVEGNVQLTEYVRTGIELDAILTSQLLINIFEKNTPLHDGAVIVRGNRVVAATCYLPLTENSEISKELGTRHRAGVGISEVCDGLVIIVSEETGAVTIAQNGRLSRDVTQDELTEALKKLQTIRDETAKERREEEKAAAELVKAVKAKTKNVDFSTAASGDTRRMKPVDLSTAASGDTRRMKPVDLSTVAGGDTRRMKPVDPGALAGSDANRAKAADHKKIHRKTADGEEASHGKKD